jgi:hypothetical protein
MEQQTDSRRCPLAEHLSVSLDVCSPASMCVLVRRLVNTKKKPYKLGREHTIVRAQVLSGCHTDTSAFSGAFHSIVRMCQSNVSGPASIRSQRRGRTRTDVR